MRYPAGRGGASRARRGTNGPRPIGAGRPRARLNANGPRPIGTGGSRVRSAYRSRKRRRGKRLWLNRALTILCVCVFLYSATRLLIAGFGYRDTRERNAELQAQHDAAQIAETVAPTEQAQTAEPAQSPVSTQSPVPTAESSEENASVDYQYIGTEVLADLVTFRNQNADLIGWLEIDDVVDLPVLYRDNVYYLSHDFYGREKSSGALFLDVNHPFTARTQHLVIHGHNMHDGSMFGGLLRYRDIDFGKEHGVAHLETLYREESYLLLAVSVTPSSSEEEGFIPFVGTPVFKDEAELNDYMDMLEDGAIYITPIDVNINDSILTLSTCFDDDRLLVTFRRMRDGETAESVRALLSDSE